MNYLDMLQIRNCHCFILVFVFNFYTRDLRVLNIYMILNSSVMFIQSLAEVPKA